jgi:hypothetical protein
VSTCWLSPLTMARESAAALKASVSVSARPVGVSAAMATLPTAAGAAKIQALSTPTARLRASRESTGMIPTGTPVTAAPPWYTTA